MDGPDPISRPILQQSWSNLAFLHWRVEASEVSPFLPPGTTPDEHDGSSWVGLIPFRLHATRTVGSLPLPWGDFCETNVRLYATDADGRRGVVFLSLDAARLAPVISARAAFGLPYVWARMRTNTRDGIHSYLSRRWSSPRGEPDSVVRVRPLPVTVRDDPLAAFLTDRWALYSRSRGRTLRLPNAHEPWPLQRAELVELRESLVRKAGIYSVAARPPDSVLYSPGVHARFGPPELLSSG